MCSIEWYDPEFNQWHCGPELDMCHSAAGIAVSKDWCVFAMGGLNGTESLNTVEMLNLSSSSPSWIPTVPMLIKRSLPGVAVMDNNIFAVCYLGLFFILKNKLLASFTIIQIYIYYLRSVDLVVQII